MKIECTVEEFKELIKSELSDVNNSLPRHRCLNELPPHTFPLFNHNLDIKEE